MLALPPQPFIYCWLNESFRKGAFKMLAILCFCWPRTRSMVDARRRRSEQASSHLMATANQIINNGSGVTNHMVTLVTPVTPVTGDTPTNNIGLIAFENAPIIADDRNSADHNSQRGKRKKFYALRLNSLRKYRKNHENGKPASEKKENSIKSLGTSKTSSTTSANDSDLPNDDDGDQAGGQATSTLIVDKAGKQFQKCQLERRDDECVAAGDTGLGNGSNDAHACTRPDNKNV